MRVSFRRLTSAFVLVLTLSISACSTPASLHPSVQLQPQCPPPVVIRDRSFRNAPPPCVYEVDITKQESTAPYGGIIANLGEVVGKRDRCMLLVQKWIELEQTKPEERNS